MVPLSKINMNKRTTCIVKHTDLWPLLTDLDDSICFRNKIILKQLSRVSCIASARALKNRLDVIFCVADWFWFLSCDIVH